MFRKLASVFANPAVAARLKDATVILQGDHGSRISLAHSQGDDPRRFSSRDLVDLHATFFAIRGPHVTPGTDSRMIALQDLFPSLVAAQPRDLQAGQLDRSIFLLRPPPQEPALEVLVGRREMPLDWASCPDSTC